MFVFLGLNILTNLIALEITVSVLSPPGEIRWLFEESFFHFIVLFFREKDLILLQYLFNITLLKWLLAVFRFA